MKAPLLALALLPAIVFANLQEGDSLERTLEVLGKPVGTIELREKTLLLYPRGEVTLKEDKVVAVDLMTAEQFAADQARLEAERIQWAEQQEMMAAEHKATGEALKMEKLKSAAFHKKPAKEQIDYWRRFESTYPEVNVGEEIAAALEAYQKELDELKSQQRIAELEARVAQAEKEAATARLETERLRKETEKTKQQTYYGLRYYTEPVVHPRYHYRPPTITIYSDGSVTQVPQHNKPYYYPKPNESTAERVNRIIHTVRENNQ